MNLAKAFLGEQEVTVRFDFGIAESAMPAMFDLAFTESVDVVTINEVQIGTTWVDASEFSEGWLEQTEQFIMDTMGPALLAEQNAAAWEDQQERQMEIGYP